MKNIFKGKKESKKDVPTDNKMVQYADDKTDNAGDESTNPDENAIQQKQLNALNKKPNLSYGEILEARRQAKKANTFARADQSAKGE